MLVSIPPCRCSTVYGISQGKPQRLMIFERHHPNLKYRRMKSCSPAASAASLRRSSVREIFGIKASCGFHGRLKQRFTEEYSEESTWKILRIDDEHPRLEQNIDPVYGCQNKSCADTAEFKAAAWEQIMCCQKPCPFGAWPRALSTVCLCKRRTKFPLILKTQFYRRKKL